ncbi:MAG: imidazolonepropionase [Bacteroidia bacterium]|nr:imidazolonepropionase [Bacteroidia bacterium]
MKLIGPFSQILTLRHLPLRGALADDQLEVIENGGIIVRDGIIDNIGSYTELLRNHQGDQEVIQEPSVLLPGWIDSHTHICFAGSRSKDYAMRIAGKSYLEIAKAGGGIWDSVQQTRNASRDELSEGIVQRVIKHQENGVTTCEIKSGYGLNTDKELKMLEAIRNADQKVAADLISTCLAAHMRPKDFDGHNQAYLEYLLKELLPKVKAKNLSQRVDIFIEESAFSPYEAETYLLQSKKIGFDITIHGDQFSTGGSAVAVNVGAMSVDHLEASSEPEIQMLSKADIVCTALPGASIGLGCPFTPARRLLDGGACVSIASDWNPGSAPMGDLLTQAVIISTFEKLSTAEVFAGITYRAAAALGLNDRGILQPGKLADMIAFPTVDYREILYHQGQLKPSTVWKRGSQIKEI